MKRKSFGVVSIIMAIQLLVLLEIFFVINYSTVKNTREASVKSMETIAEERSQIIENFVNQAENFLVDYSKSGEIAALLLNPEDAECQKKAQEYTVRFGEDYDFLEGIYASMWNTKVLTHSNEKVIGITTREGDSLKKLQDEMVKAGKGVYNTGIIMSPASGKQILSIYKAVYDNTGNPIGLVGCGIYTEGLVNTLNELPNNGMDNLKYCLVGTENGEYIFCEEPDKIKTVATEEYINKIIASEDINGSITFKDNSSYFAAYHKMDNHGWTFILTDPSSEVFAGIKTIRSRMILICAVGLIILFISSFLVIEKLLKPVRSAEVVLAKVKDGDLTDNEAMHKYMHRKDELGKIAQSTEVLVKSLNEVVHTLHDCGECLNDKTEDLNRQSEELVSCVVDNTATIEELTASHENTNVIVEDVHKKVIDINAWMETTLKQLSSSMDTSADLIERSENMSKKANESYQISYETFEKTKIAVGEAMERLSAVSKINDLVDDILEISSQTNLLALNASIEAARAGATGRGFAVVATEIGNLADTSQTTATDIQNLCCNINENVSVVKDCFNTIMKFFEETVMYEFKGFAKNADEYNVSASEIRESIGRLNDSTDILNESLQQIMESMASVKEITNENNSAINLISEKNLTTSTIADEIRQQSDSNKALVSQLKNIVDHFKI